MAKINAVDYQKVIKKLKNTKTELQTQIKEIERKIEKASDLVKELKNTCRHEYEFIICKNPENPTPIEEKELKTNFPDINYRIKIDNEKSQFLYRGGTYEELVRFLTYYNIVLVCKKCGSKNLLGIGCEDEVGLVIKVKSKTPPKKKK